MQSTISNTVIDSSALKGIAPTVTNAIKTASAKTGIDFSYLMNQAKAESNFDSSAKAKSSSATGLYQFIENTWLKMVKEHGAEYGLGTEAAAITETPGTHKLSVSSHSMRKAILDLRKDPELASAMAAEFASENKEYLELRVKGRNIEGTELYFAHFLGAGGASRFLNKLGENPNAIAAHSFPRAAQANRNVFYEPSTGQPRTMRQVYDFFDKKFSTDYGQAPLTIDNTTINNKGGISLNNLNVFQAAKQQSTSAGYSPFLGLANNIKNPQELYISALMAMPSPMDNDSSDKNAQNQNAHNEKTYPINSLQQRLRNPAILQLLNG